eukprot:TRINITY_DN37146_c0_g1_i1.p1 TRINITY_DN37146_c0_g1~~TRINITY_DN37146_c0_g1_i1.p1  ORF type:complete len:139 (+),score=15.89 TRINITY_DN37146_c0_g1_i1:29-418(+)
MFVEQVTMSPQTWDFVAINPSSSPMMMSLPSNTSFSTLDGSGAYVCSLTLPPWSSKLLVYKAMHNGSSCTAPALSTSTTSSSTTTSILSSTSLSPSPPVPSNSNRNAYSAPKFIPFTVVGVVLFIVACV